MSRPKPLVLIIFDGWGYRAETKANAIARSRKPTLLRIESELEDSARFLGLKTLNYRK